ncbi:hypothetical protein ES332_A04G070600v1 [Gossypium tomentosum]|uniref:Uncharacterized protein n=1 Tax=Gossypium tomentosum TaxID=34277 RepID=A0A5D2QV93_GOSTO|nr:hypothetical protein ES332_A04G070600v1 [Gossypium tomentosum]
MKAKRKEKKILVRTLGLLSIYLTTNVDGDTTAGCQRRCRGLPIWGNWGKNKGNRGRGEMVWEK